MNWLVVVVALAILIFVVCLWNKNNDSVENFTNNQFWPYHYYAYNGVFDRMRLIAPGFYTTSNWTWNLRHPYREIMNP